MYLSIPVDLTITSRYIIIVLIILVLLYGLPFLLQDILMKFLYLGEYTCLYHVNKSHTVPSVVMFLCIYYTASRHNLVRVVTHYNHSVSVEMCSCILTIIPYSGSFLWGKIFVVFVVEHWSTNILTEATLTPLPAVQSASSNHVTTN